jgi:hypothetical protein
MVRMPERLHKRLTELARESSRSLNYEIITRLSASIELDRLLKIDDANEALLAMGKLKRRLVDLRLQEGDE